MSRLGRRYSDYASWLDRRRKENGMEKDLPALMAAGYRTGSRTVVEAGGVPARVRPHVERGRRYPAECAR
ncbi:hypothetical protein [Streptomyces sp. NPDC006925]|uniref:hypothetical protein n=1 Tax=Streptomyces sp. NPDC006925 TaxID=3364768 RepID=UPI0036B08D7D